MNTAFASYVIVAWVVLAVAVFPSFPRGVACSSSFSPACCSCPFSIAG